MYVLQQVGSAAADAVSGPQPKAKPGPKPKAKPGPKPKAKQGPKPKAEPGPKPNAKSGHEKAKLAKPSFGVERSRSQVMCRTGIGGPDSTHKIPYGKGLKCKTEEDAVAVARKWVLAQVKRQA